MSFVELVSWLKEKTVLSILEQKSLEVLAALLEERVVLANQSLVLKNTSPEGLYILRSGHLEKDDQRSQSISFLPGSAINLQELLLKQPVQHNLVTKSSCQFWFISAEKFQEFVAQFPEITQAFLQKLAEEVEKLSSQLNSKQEIQSILRPYLVTKAKRGIIGKSRYAVRLRSQIKQASQNRDPILIFGEPGLEKDNIAVLIHFGSPYRRESIIQVDCSTLQESGAELFGRVGGQPGLIEALGQGTLVFNDIQELAPELIEAIANLLKTNTYFPVSRQGETVTQPKICQARLLFIGEKNIPDINAWIKTTIKVPPLRVRKADISDQMDYYIALICRKKGLKKPSVSTEALRRLQAYDFPNNLKELESLVARIMVQLEGHTEITEEIIWPSQSKKKQFRLNLLNTYPNLRRFLRSSWWPDRLNYGFTLTAFAVVVGLLFIGPQARSENVALLLFWAWWWPLVLMGFPFVGRLWCAVCPFMIYGEITQKLSLWLFPRQLKRWPRQSAEKWGGWFLFGLFALILLWEELWDLENTAYLSACLLLLITAGAMIFSAIFERRFWCRYLCPIGGMNGMFAKLSMIELRAVQGTCSAECTTYQCYKGGPKKGEGLETMGCPLYSHPAQLEDNRDCVLCMTCLKACPHRSVEVNLRPPGIELWTTHVPRFYEVALLFLLLDAVFLHRLPELQSRLGITLDLDNFWTHLEVSIGALSCPVLIPLIAQGIMSLLAKMSLTIKDHGLLKLAYGYLPLVLGVNLAHYLRLGLGEAGRILPVTWATIGLNGADLPIWVAHPAVIAFLQGTTLLMAMILSVLLTQKIASRSFLGLLPQHLSTLVLGVGFWQIIVG